MFLDLDLLGIGFSDKFDRSGFRVSLDVWILVFFKDLNQTGFFFRTLDFGFESLINSYLTIQTYDPTAASARE
jgi:hypothetical protein